jgi:galactonate dehydratase
MVIGEDPTNIEHLYQKMFRQSFWSLGVIGMSALSAIEQALWDIKSKHLGVPAFELLGGKVRDRVRMYTHLGGGNMKAVYETFSVEPLIALARQVTDRGYNAVKVVFVPYSKGLEGHGKVRQFAKLFETLRKAVGPDTDIMVDFHGRTSPAMAIQYINAIESYHPFFCEEPVRPENVAAIKMVTEHTNVPIAAGERLVSIHQYRDLFEKNAVHVIQPDLCHCGGLWAAKKIAAQAEVYHMAVAPHNPLGPVANAVALHYAVSTPNFLIQEDMLTDVPWRWDVVETEIVSENGYWKVPARPGLGIEINEREAKKHPFRQEIIHANTIRDNDNAILDW